jgi:hypothetical protein
VLNRLAIPLKVSPDLTLYVLAEADDAEGLGVGVALAVGVGVGVTGAGAAETLSCTAAEPL